jgi:hypothetical protein
MMRRPTPWPWKTRKKAKPAGRRSVQDQLDEALADSFPASDPVSFVTSQTEEDWNDDAEKQDNASHPGGTPAKAASFAGRKDER